MLGKQGGKGKGMARCLETSLLLKKSIGSHYALVGYSAKMITGVKSAIKLLVTAAILFICLHLIPRMLFNVYGVIWGTIIPIGLAVIVTCSLLYTLFLFVRCVIISFSLSNSTKKLLSKKLYCQVCGKDVEMNLDLLNELLKETDEGNPKKRESSTWFFCSECSESCKKESDNLQQSPKFCWRCGKESSNCLGKSVAMLFGS